jgi:hypothetical protein
MLGGGGGPTFFVNGISFETRPLRPIRPLSIHIKALREGGLKDDPPGFVRSVPDGDLVIPQPPSALLEHLVELVREAKGCDPRQYGDDPV